MEQMEWSDYDLNTELAVGNHLAIEDENNERLGTITSWDQSNRSGTFSEQIAPGQNTNHSFSINDDKEFISVVAGNLGEVVQYSTSPFPQGGVLIRPQ